MRKPWREKIEWKLITNLPVESVEAAVEKLRWYAMRWKIETSHKTMLERTAPEAPPEVALTTTENPAAGSADKAKAVGRAAPQNPFRIPQQDCQAWRLSGPASDPPPGKNVPAH